MNNNIYGMTGGQYSPSTGYGDFATTAPYGNIDQPFDVVKLALGAGASFEICLNITSLKQPR